MTSGGAERAVGARRAIEGAMRTSHGRALAVVAAQLRDFDLAEDAVQDAWLEATRTWGDTGVPDNPTAWIVTTARRRAIDRLRRRDRNDRVTERITSELLTAPADDDWVDDTDIPDERLTLLFTCCHPALAPDARVALTLRAVGGLTTREIARAFGTTERTMQQRLVRTKQRIVTAGIPYRVPERDELPERLAGTHAVIYAMFTEGYSATDHPDFLRVDLTDEAIRLAGLVDDLLPDQAESLGLRALLLLHDARRVGRRDASGSLVLLDDQDRTTWDRHQIAEALAHLDRALERHDPGPYQLQAAVAALHAEAESVETTDWVQITALYGLLVERWPSAAARLALAVAAGMADGPDAGLRALRSIEEELGDDHRWHAANGHFQALAGRSGDADDSFERAADLARHPLEAERLRARVTRR